MSASRPMNDATVISVHDLRDALTRLMDAVEDGLGPEIDLGADYYWDVRLSTAFDPAGEPKIDAGQLSDDIESVHEFLTRDKADGVFVWHDLGHVIGLLRRIAALDLP